MAKAKTKAKAVAPKKAAAKATPKKPVAKVAPVKETKQKKYPVNGTLGVPDQMTGKPRAAKKGDNGGPTDGLDFDTGQESVKRSPKALQSLIDKGNELLDLQDKIDKISVLLQDTQAQASEIANKELPKMMGDLQMTSIGLRDGMTLELTDKLIGSLPKEPAARAKAFEIIEEREGGDIIKSFLTVGFSKSEYDKAQALQEELKERELPAELEISVNHQTFLAWAKEHLADEANNDDPLPLADLGLSFIHFARVKEPKKTKAQK